MNNIFRQLKSATSFVPIPENTLELGSVVLSAQKMEKEFASCFWNTAQKHDLTDAQYLSMVIFVLKTRGGHKGIAAALQLVQDLEEHSGVIPDRNVNLYSGSTHCFWRMPVNPIQRTKNEHRAIHCSRET